MKPNTINKHIIRRNVEKFRKLKAVLNLKNTCGYNSKQQALHLLKYE